MENISYNDVDEIWEFEKTIPDKVLRHITARVLWYCQNEGTNHSPKEVFEQVFGKNN